ncbi:acyl carrier protein [Acidobacteria bacterium AB60]|nr:acyl carrier protein [Acidobacteria bacterium AB60]
MQSRVHELRSFVVKNFLFGEDQRLDNADSFLDNGIIDSTGILELVMYLQHTYEIEIYDEELIPDNLDSVNRLAAFVEHKLAMPAVSKVS